VEDLIRRILDLDPLAYEEFSQQFGPILLASLLARRLPQAEAERLAAECVKALLSRVAQYDPTASSLFDWVLAYAEECYEALIRRLFALQADLKWAADTQAAMLPPQRPRVAGLDVCFLHRPLRLVTGDFCELMNAPEQTLIALGDASGKGASAAIYSAVAGSRLRGLWGPKTQPLELLTQLDAVLKASPIGTQYATLLVARWHPQTRLLALHAGAAPPPILVRRGELTWLTVEGSALGHPIPPSFGSHELALFPADTLILYSDGISDQPDSEGQPYGDFRLADTARRVAELDIEEAASAILADLDQYADGQPQHDDQMLLVARVHADLAV
jgi:sigma-B regulation protein RsbU (phosphoserine phosphatase)